MNTKKFNEAIENMEYLMEEFSDALWRSRKDIPEDLIKLFNDYIYHSKKEIKNIKEEFNEYLKTRDNSL